jgi:hypothetical protein
VTMFKYRADRASEHDPTPDVQFKIHVQFIKYKYRKFEVSTALVS